MSLIPRPVRRGFEALLDPLVHWLIARRVSPNVLTTAGTAVLLGSGVAFGYAQVRLGALLLLLSGVADMLDGRVARGSGGASTFGAFYDSTLDRVGEATLFAGILLLFMQGGVPQQWQLVGVVSALVALAAGLLVSYARARAEGLGLECKVGLAQRAERILGLGVPTLIFGAGPNGLLLLAIVAVLALVNAITVGQRIAHVYRITRRDARHETRPKRTTEVRRAAPELAKYMGERTER